MAWRSEEIEIVPDWQTVLWDVVKGEIYQGGLPTGTNPIMWGGKPRLQERRIENIYGRPIHKDCGGSLEIAKEQDGCGNMQARVRCISCGKEFCADF